MYKALKFKIKGSLYGMAIGDSLGTSTEFMYQSEIQKKYKLHKDLVGGGWLNLFPGEVSDPTEITLCVCRALEKTPRFDTRIGLGSLFFQNCCQELSDWLDSRPRDMDLCCRNVIEHCKNAPYSDWFSYAADSSNIEPRERYSNGSLLQTLPLILTGAPLSSVLYLSRMTHNNPVCDKAVTDFYLQLYSCMEGTFDKTVHSTCDFTPIRHVQNTLDRALFHLSHTNCMEDAVVEAVNAGGDTNVIGAITGCLAGALYGYENIPERWIKVLDSSIKNQLDYYSDLFFRHNFEVSA